MAVLTFSNCLGGAVTIAIGQTLLLQGLEKCLPKYVSHSGGLAVSAKDVIDAGANGIAAVVHDSRQVAQVRLAYAAALREVFILGIACAGAGFLAAFCVSSPDHRLT